MARHGYDVEICDEAGCRVVARKRKLEAAIKALAKEGRRRAKRMLKSKAPEGSVRGHVKETGRGLPEDGQVVYRWDFSAGKPGGGRRRQSRRPRREAAPEGAEE